MKKSVLILSFGFLFLLLSVQAVKCAEKTLPAKADASPLQITISTAKDTFSIGEEIPVTVVYKNTSAQPIRILNLEIWAHPLIFVVFDSKGQHSVRCRAHRYKIRVDYGKDFADLGSQETKRLVIDINQYFIFTEPDIYLIRAMYTGFWELPETYSNDISLKLVKRQGLSKQGSLEDDLASICQLSLDLDWLQKFFHAYLPERRPLVIQKNIFFDQKIPQLTKFGEPVVFLSEKEIEQKIEQKKIEAYFVFRNIIISDQSAFVEFYYPVEGVVGEIHFRKGPLGWEISEQKGGEI